MTLSIVWPMSKYLQTVCLWDRCSECSGTDNTDDIQWCVSFEDGMMILYNFGAERNYFAPFVPHLESFLPVEFFNMVQIFLRYHLLEMHQWTLPKTIAKIKKVIRLLEIVYGCVNSAENETIYWKQPRSSIRLLCLLWIDKTRDTDKTYIWVSVWWKTKN